MRIKEMKGGRELMKRQLNIHSHSASHFHSRAVSVSRVVSVSQAISLYSPKMKNMKSIFTTAFVMLITTFLCAQAPQGIPYQAVMRNAGGSVMASSAVSLTFMIHDGAATGAVVYQESHSLNSNAQGLVSCVVGDGVVSQGDFSNINWGVGAKFLQVMMGSTDLGTQQMLSVPYALNAGEVPSRVSDTGDSLWVGDTFVIVPGISVANYSAPVLGCANAQACNYNPAATQDDGSCLYQNATCNDNNANTINDVINSNCQCVGTALGIITYSAGNGVTDIDGNAYTSIIINGQEWMQQNLAVTKYRNGDPIATGLSNTAWVSTTSGAYALYNDNVMNNAMYGKLYNWFAVNDVRGLCPTGWHVPSNVEWSTLIDYLDPNASGGDSYPNSAGGHMKSTSGWDSPNEGATNESGFTGLPGGFRDFDGPYNYIGRHGFWWSSTAFDNTGAWHRELYFNDTNVFRQDLLKQFGFSVRCVRD
jgi:uncharacterized protein (TIGR02145 family)